MPSIHSVILESPDAKAANEFYENAFDLGSRLAVRQSDATTEGFRGFTLSLVTPQPANVDAIIAAALDAGASTLKSPARSLWGYGGGFSAPDGAIWTVASSSKKDSGPASRQFDEFVLLLGVADVSASKQFYVDKGLTLGRSFGKYVEFENSSGGVNFALNGRKALAKNAGVAQEGTGSHRLVIVGDAGSFTDPDGFSWESIADSSGMGDSGVISPNLGE